MSRAAASVDGRRGCRRSSPRWRSRRRDRLRQERAEPLRGGRALRRRGPAARGDPRVPQRRRQGIRSSPRRSSSSPSASDEVGDQTRAPAGVRKAADLLPKRRRRADARRVAAAAGAAGSSEARARADKAIALAPTERRRAGAARQRAGRARGPRPALEQMERPSASIPRPRCTATSARCGWRAASARRPRRRSASAVALEPKSVTPHLALGNYLWASGRLAEAEAALKAAYAAEPANMLAQPRAGDVLPGERPRRRGRAVPGQRRRRRPHRRRAAGAGQLLRVGGPAADARRVLEEAAKMPRGWAVARSRLAALQLADGQRRRRRWRRSTRSWSGSRRTPRPCSPRRGSCWRAAGPTTRSSWRGRRSPRIRAARTAHYLLGTILAARGDFDGAVKAFNEVLRLNPRAAAAYVQLARIELLRGAPAASAQMASRRSPQDPGNADGPADAGAGAARPAPAGAGGSGDRPPAEGVSATAPRSHVQRRRAARRSRATRAARARVRAGAGARPGVRPTRCRRSTSLDVRRGQGRGGAGPPRDAAGRSAPKDAALLVLDARAALAIEADRSGDRRS